MVLKEIREITISKTIINFRIGFDIFIILYCIYIGTKILFHKCFVTINIICVMNLIGHVSLFCYDRVINDFTLLAIYSMLKPFFNRKFLG